MVGKRQRRLMKAQAIPKRRMGAMPQSRNIKSLWSQNPLNGRHPKRDVREENEAISRSLLIQNKIDWRLLLWVKLLA